MADFLSCIDEAASAGDIDPEAADRARKTYRRAFGPASEAFGPTEADRMAAEAVMSDLERAALEAKRRKALMIRTRTQVLEGVAALKRTRGYADVNDLGGGGGDGGDWTQGGLPPGEGPGKGGAIFARSLELLVENKPGLSGGPFSSVEDRYRAIRGQADAMMAGLIERFETRTGFDTPNRAELAGAIDLETRFAAPETTLWTRAKLLGTERPGTITGEIRRSWAMFRSFSLTATHLFAEEAALRGQKTVSPHAATAATLASHLVWLTIAGAAGIQLRELTKGNDTRPMDNPKFWGQALLQGGGVGILGDFLFAAEKRNGTDQLDAFGPGGAAISDIYGATVGNVVEVGSDMAEGASLDEAVNDARVGREMSGLIRNYTPFSTLWWTRATWHRAVADNVQRILDPEAEEDFERRRKRQERDFGTTSWWPQGAAPERLPDLSDLSYGAEDQP